MPDFAPDCPFCSIDPARVLAESEVAVAIPDNYPLSPGHTLVVPRLHVGTIYQLTAAQQAALWKFVGQVRRLLLRRYKPDGLNIGVNDGPAAGQTVEHAHIHLIPRRSGDVPDPRGGIRWIIADKAAYWK